VLQLLTLARQKANTLYVIGGAVSCSTWKKSKEREEKGSLNLSTKLSTVAGVLLALSFTQPVQDRKEVAIPAKR
jgi:hypothetical protein